MRFRHLRMQNFKCYADAELKLDTGVTVIHGVNGSGKSSLLEACFFALYGSKALDDRTLDDVITNGAKDAEIELVFDHAGESYSIERRLRMSGDRATTAKCVLDGPDETIEGARAVRGAITKLLRMDAEAFVNCAYVRQGEVNKLIHASPSDRQDMIDDLLQLGKLEDYRERASEARLAVKTVLDGQRDVLDNLEERIEAKEEKGLHVTLNELETELKDARSEVDRLEDQIESAQETKSDAESVLAEYDEKRERIQTLDADIQALRSKINETEHERDQLQTRLNEERERRDDLRSERDELLADTEFDTDADADDVQKKLDQLQKRDEELRDRLESINVEIQEHVSTEENARERAEELKDEADTAREEADRLEAELEDDKAELDDRRCRLSEIGEQIDEAREQFTDAPIDFGEAADHEASLAEELETLRESLTEVTTELETTRSTVEQAESLLEAGKCPECGQPVEESPHVDSLSDDRERVEELTERRAEIRERIEHLEKELDHASKLQDAERQVQRLRDNRNSMEQLIEGKEASLTEKHERIDDLRDRAAEFDERSDDKRQVATKASKAAEDRREDIASINADRGELREQRNRLEELSDVIEAIENCEAAIGDAREKRTNKAELNDERRERVTEKRERKRTLETEFDEKNVENAREQKRRAQSYLEDAKPVLEAERERRDELIDRIGGVKAELDELESLRNERDELAERRNALESLYDEVETLQETYGDLRAELRQRNVETLERMLNETFELVYQNDSYSHIELDGEYELTVYQKDGAPLDPEQLSGGERALFNLSLRCAIYRLLAEGIEGAAPMPPLILDEPTVFLDSGHVSQLVELIGSMRDLGVEQIIVVSHDDELVGAAEDVVEVRKDPTSNRSTVTRQERVEPATIGD